MTQILLGLLLPLPHFLMHHPVRPSEKSGGPGGVWLSLVGRKGNHQIHSTEANASQKVQPCPMIEWAWLDAIGLDSVIAQSSPISPNVGWHVHRARWPWVGLVGLHWVGMKASYSLSLNEAQRKFECY